MVVVEIIKIAIATNENNMKLILIDLKMVMIIPRDAKTPIQLLLFQNSLGILHKTKINGKNAITLISLKKCLFPIINQVTEITPSKMKNL